MPGPIGMVPYQGMPRAEANNIAERHELLTYIAIPMIFGGLAWPSMVRAFPDSPGKAFLVSFAPALAPLFFVAATRVCQAVRGVFN